MPGRLSRDDRAHLALSPMSFCRLPTMKLSRLAARPVAAVVTDVQVGAGSSAAIRAHVAVNADLAAVGARVQVDR
jgi:hypothetical protein